MTTLALPATLDLSAATRLADDLRRSGGALTIDAGAVERIGVAGLQVLLSAVLHGLVDGTVSLENPSEALCVAARSAGADYLLPRDR